LVNPTSTEAGDNASFFQRLAMLEAVKASVGMQFFRTIFDLSIRSGQLRDGIHDLQQYGIIAYIDRSMPYNECNFSSSTIRWLFETDLHRSVGFGPVFSPQPGASTLPASMHALDQSIWSALDKYPKNGRCSFSHIPSYCQSRNHRQQLMPLPNLISGGSITP
jgi:hypothetical protein